MSTLCWHYTPSLWPWNLWTLSRSVSMATTQGRLLVTCVGGFACTERELHNSLHRVFDSAQQFEIRFNCMNPDAEQLQSLCGGMATSWLYFSSSWVASVILTHYIIASGLTAAPQPWDSQLCLALSRSVRGVKRECLWLPPCPSDKGIMISPHGPPRVKIPPCHVERLLCGES